jgi:5-methylcytosine-specific restriction endonuclease McrBC regulatory subunit McrC
MGSLAPDVELRGAERVVWLDAKYKRHVELLARRGWQGASDELRHDHRADLHQALAYASLTDVSRVDTVLVYPHAGESPLRSATIARVASGRRLVRLILASLPFGYRNRDQQESCIRSFRELLAP